MTTKTLPARNEIAPEYKWNLEAVYPEDARWESEYAELGPLLEQVKQETATQLNAAKDEIAQQTAAARQTLEHEARAMAATISSQILKRPVG